MRRGLSSAMSLGIVLVLVTPLAAQAQNNNRYPGGYGGYGWGGWGSNPASGYMAGLGSYARGEGAYEVEAAQAKQINLDTMLKWNKALRARQATLQAEKTKKNAADEVKRQDELERVSLEDGTTLNALLTQVYDLDPATLKSSKARTPIPAAAVREIPFEWDSEALTICLDQMTGLDALPDPLNRPAYREERNALNEAIQTALKEDAKGDVSAETSRRIHDKLSAFRDHVFKDSTEFDPADSPVGQYFNTMAAVTKLLNDPGMKKILNELDGDRKLTLGDLIAFMHSYNLRFGAATTGPQAQVYRALGPAMTQLLADMGPADAATPAPAGADDSSGETLRSAAKNVFKGMRWDQAHSAATQP